MSGPEIMDWYNPNDVTVKSQCYNSFVILLLTVYTFWMLTLMDFVLLQTVKGYQSVDSFWLGAIIFFIASHVFIHLFKVYRWKNHLFYYIGGLATFFPLVLLASMLRVSLNLSESSFLSYTEIYCPQLSTNETPICGKAFAFIVYSMTVRALPIVVTIPILYRWFYVEFPPLVERIMNKTQ